MVDTNESRTAFLTQKQLAQRWQMSPSCVKNYRDKGLVPFLRLPTTRRILYPLDQIEQLELKNIQPCGKETSPRPEKKRKKLEVSSTTHDGKKWRI
jgi:hypothetical protein